MFAIQMSNEVSHNPEIHANNENSLDKNAIENIIAQGIANAIPLIIKAVKNPVEPTKAMSSKHTRDNSFSHSVNGGNDDTIKTPFPNKMKAMSLECTYKEFLACKPTEFAGSKGATTALRWLEKTEVVLKISKCAEEDKVMYASNLLKEEALEWWNTIFQAKGSDMTYAMNWEKFKEIAERKFCPPYEKERMANKFLNHKMIDINCREYTTTFFEYARI
ncbi:putative retrotransposon gag domain-containing protein [Helianthus annuus]|nr:putative retrotransposon gag domain-containing protein [Helianthus annuus]